MSTTEPAITFREMLAYTDFLAQRWLDYFKKNEPALAVEVGGRTPTLRDLVSHIFQVELFFANLLFDPAATPTARPPNLESPSLDALERMHQEAHQKLCQYVGSVSEETLRQARKLGPTTASNRKILAQATLHGVHHWAQVATEVRQAGFPTLPPQDIIISPAME
ncbi:MAG TPA: DinB family protein [Candidatus Angelobacter sp.]|nr:DinB family protein [Candidatus Angelobacter sp.]